MTVLIVDDTEDNITVLERQVRKAGNHVVRGFTDPALALHWCEVGNPDLVFVDYIMPHVNGLEFLQRFRALPGHDDIPLVMITACGEAELRQAALEAGATEFLTRPAQPIEIVARTRNLLRLRAVTRKLADQTDWLQREVRNATGQIERRVREMLFSLGRAAEFRDPETGAHIQRMANYSRLIAERLGLSAEMRDTLLQAAPMHDIGKLGIPDEILLKPGKLTAAEFEVMKRHPMHGYEMLRHSDVPLIQAGATIALTHHEKWDGSGYPNKLAGADIPLLGRIVAVADVFDAVTSVRPYKPAWDLERSATLLREQSGKHFDPACVQAFFAAWPQVLETRETYRDPVDTNERLTKAGIARHMNVVAPLR
ncbi:MAG: response regulator [Betaproteobacteria bacterium]|nr:response regulator [Betaproteobacteria bacterium]